MKYSCETLPEGYRECMKVDLAKNKKQALLVNLAALVIAVIMFVPATLHIPFERLYSMDGGLGLYAVRFVTLMVSAVAYILLHELTHGIFIRIFTKKRPYYGFTLMYAFAGSRDYLTKIPYLIVALAPVVIWGIVLGVLLLFVPDAWFWVVYLILMFNCSGAAGDLYVTLRFMRMPADLLVMDVGTAMTVYSKE